MTVCVYTMCVVSSSVVSYVYYLVPGTFSVCVCSYYISDIFSHPTLLSRICLSPAQTDMYSPLLPPPLSPYAALLRREEERICSCCAVSLLSLSSGLALSSLPHLGLPMPSPYVCVTLYPTKHLCFHASCVCLERRGSERTGMGLGLEEEEGAAGAAHPASDPLPCSVPLCLLSLSFLPSHSLLEKHAGCFSCPAPCPRPHSPACKPLCIIIWVLVVCLCWDIYAQAYCLYVSLCLLSPQPVYREERTWDDGVMPDDDGRKRARVGGRARAARALARWAGQAGRGAPSPLSAAGEGSVAVSSLSVPKKHLSLNLRKEQTF